MMARGDSISSPAALSIRGVGKRFGATVANEDVSAEFHCGRIHALLGENGAGKSTLVSMLYGLYPPDAGDLFLDGELIQLNHPADALRLGIGLVQQHFSLIPSFTVLENILLGQETGTVWRLNRHEAERTVREALKPFGLNLPLGTPVGELPVGIQQQVEIAKILYRRVRILLLDEPTAALAPGEIDAFLSMLRRLKKEGLAIVLITHRLPEVLQAADDVTVLRRGRVVLQGTLAEFHSNRIAMAIVGEHLPEEAFERNPISDIVFSLLNITTRRGVSRQALHSISLDVRAGEIVGIAGVSGNGQEEMIDVILGLEPPVSGEIVLNSNKLAGFSTQQRKEMGIAYIPQDRWGEGMLAEHSIVENYMLSPQSFSSRRRFKVSFKHLQREVSRQIESYEIKTDSAEVLMKRLSGGHQQRVVISREFMAHPKLILAHNPTRGLDLRAGRFVHRTLHEACARGAGALLFSSELSELFLLCQRIAVLHRGTVSEIRASQEWTAADLGRALSGAAV